MSRMEDVFRTKKVRLQKYLLSCSTIHAVVKILNNFVFMSHGQRKHNWWVKIRCNLNESRKNVNDRNHDFTSGYHFT